MLSLSALKRGTSLCRVTWQPAPFAQVTFLLNKIRKTLSSTGCLLLSSQVSGLVTFSLWQPNVRAVMQLDTLSIQSRIWKCIPLCVESVMGSGTTQVWVATGLCAGQPKALLPIWLLKTVGKTFSSGDKSCMYNGTTTKLNANHSEVFRQCFNINVIIKIVQKIIYFHNPYKKGWRIKDNLLFVLQSKR